MLVVYVSRLLQIPCNTLIKINSKVHVIQTPQCSEVVKAVLLVLIDDTEVVKELFKASAASRLNRVGILSLRNGGDTLCLGSCTLLYLCRIVFNLFHLKEQKQPFFILKICPF